MKRSFIADGITFFFILLFFYTGLMKLIDIPSVQQQLAVSPLTGAIANIITWALPIAEILLAITLLIPKWRLLGLYLTLGLMSIFTIYVSAIFASGNQPMCSCGGIIADLSPSQHIIFNSACVLLSLTGILAVRHQQPTVQFKWLTGSSFVALLATVGWLLFSAFNAPAIKKTGKEGKPFPALNLQLPDSVSYFNTSQIPTGKPFIVVAFDPWCSHCQELMADIKTHITEFNSAHVYYITIEPLHKMRTFYRYFKLANFPGITVGKDTANAFIPYFNVTKIPYVSIFDAKKQLRSVVDGRVTAVQLTQLIEY